MSLEEQYAEAQRLLDDVLRRKERVQSGMPEFEETVKEPSVKEKADEPESFMSEVQESLMAISKTVQELNGFNDSTLLNLTNLISDLNLKFTTEINAQAKHREREKQTLDEIEKYLRKWG